ncbi:MAG: LCP family protein [Clostridia bacterium]|nr:LCP family protein [Clostridia bacterium]
MMKRLTALLLAFLMLFGCVAFGEDTIDMNAGETEEAESVTEEADTSEEEEFFISDEMEEEIEILDAEIDDTVDPDNLDLNENLPDNVVNILLIGIDSRALDLTKHNQHGDVQIIVSINKDTGSIKLTSVLRDLYVTIPGYKSKNRINVSYKRGGGELAMRTINKNFELNIEKYIVINFYGLASIIDALGGVDIEMTAKEANAINAYIKKNPPAYDNQDDDYERVPLEKIDGVQHLDGIQAVMYARVRSIDNDFARTGRQRKLMEILLNKVLEDGMNYDKLLDLLSTCLPYAKTNMSASDMFSLALGVLQSGIMNKIGTGESLLEQSRIPLDDTWKYDETESGASVVAFRTTARLKENIQALHEFIYGEYIPAE